MVRPARNASSGLGGGKCQIFTVSLAGAPFLRSSALPPATPPSKIFVGDSNTPAIGSSPNSNPSPGQVVVERIISGPNTMLSSALVDFALDVVRDRLYVADQRSILVFDNISTAEGNIMVFDNASTKGGADTPDRAINLPGAA
jgi:hypothetical protein